MSTNCTSTRWATMYKYYETIKFETHCHPQGTYPFSGRECRHCPHACAECEGAQSCTRCHEGYALSAEKGVCVANCGEAGRKFKRKTFSTSFILKNGLRFISDSATWSKLLRFLSVRNLKPKFNPFFKPKLRLKFSIELSPRVQVGRRGLPEVPRDVQDLRRAGHSQRFERWRRQVHSWPFL